MEECLFCKWQKQEGRMILENELAYASFDEFSVNPGHVLIMTKRHTKDFFEATDKEKNDIFDLVDKAKKLVDKEHHPDGYNIGMNCGIPAGQSVMHVHVHLIPRYVGDVEDPRGGVRGVIPKKQQY